MKKVEDGFCGQFVVLMMDCWCGLFWRNSCLNLMVGPPSY
ncbi:unnamed protein product, partial [Rotaria socialis]